LRAEVEIRFMEIVVGIEKLDRPFANPVLTIGNFDGVHLGHQALFRRVKERARELGGQSLIMTFDPHPLQVLRPDNHIQLLTPGSSKLDLIARCDIDATIVVPFTRELASLSAREFVEDVLVKRIGVRALIVGYDYRFGAGREGTTESLKEMGRRYGFEVEVVSGIEIEGRVVSSTAIRELIGSGKVREASGLLGRPYEIRGVVVKGRERGGRLLGFPTANVACEARPPLERGVYAVRARVDGVWCDGAANVGFNPTFGDTDLSLEVHLFDFQRDIYSRPVVVRFVDWIRPEQRFSGPEELKAQIGRDVMRAREILSRNPEC